MIYARVCVQCVRVHIPRGLCVLDHVHQNQSGDQIGRGSRPAGSVAHRRAVGERDNRTAVSVFIYEIVNCTAQKISYF